MAVASMTTSMPTSVAPPVSTSIVQKTRPGGAEIVEAGEGVRNVIEHIGADRDEHEGNRAR